MRTEKTGRRIDMTHYSFSDSFHKRIALVSDLHDSPYEELLLMLKAQNPDAICIPGDIGIRHVSAYPRENIQYREPLFAFDFLREVRELAPVYMSRGNHEYRWDGYDIAELTRRGIRFVENNWAEENGLLIGGFPSCYAPYRKEIKPDVSWLDTFERQEGFKLLLCHHPEYYEPFLQGRKINLILSGHAHGGQIRLGNRGLYAPGQGLFPKLTSGIYDGKLVISRGLSNQGIRIPRINNLFELVFIDI